MGKVEDLTEKARKAKENATFGSCMVGCLAIICIWAGTCGGFALALYIAAWALAAGWRAGIAG